MNDIRYFDLDHEFVQSTILRSYTVISMSSSKFMIDTFLCHNEVKYESSMISTLSPWTVETGILRVERHPDTSFQQSFS